MAKMIRTVKFAVILCVMIFMVSMSANAAGAQSNSIVSALLTKDLKTLEIKVQLTDDYAKTNKGETLYLFEILPYQSASQINSMTPVTEAKISTDLTIKLPFDIEDKTKIYAKYLICTKNQDNTYSLIEQTGARFIDNPHAVAKHTYAYPEVSSKKGLWIQLPSDAQELGVSHTVLNIPLNEYLLTESGDNAVSYVFDNKTYYISKEKLDLLDHKIRVYSEAGIRVYLNIMLSVPNDMMSDKLKCLYYDDIMTSAKLFAFNTTNKESILYLEGFLNFLAERYTRPDREYGFAGSFIFGYEVNSNRMWNNMGQRSLDAYLNSYVTAFRIADTALRSVYSNGRVYMSVANNFNVPSNDRSVITDSMLDYSVKELIDKFTEKVEYAGDIPWNLAINPYPSDLLRTDFWNDDEAIDNINTQYMTMKNIDILCEYLSREEFLYNGDKRRILISEFGINANPEGADLPLQAAAYAYAYYKAEFNSAIEAIIYQRHVDRSAEEGLYFGLWSNEPGTQWTPQSKKKIYDVFKYIDTQRSIDITSFALQLLNISSWDAVIKDFDSDNVIKRDICETIPVLRSDIGKGYTEHILFDFAEGDMYDFYPSDNAKYIELRADSSDTSDSSAGKSRLYAGMINKYPNEYMGIGCKFDKPMNIKNVDYVTLTFKAEAPADVTSLTMMLRLYSNGMTYEGIGQVKPGEWDEITFKLASLDDKHEFADGMKIWIKSYDGKYYEGDYGLWLNQVILDQKDTVSIVAVVLWTLLVIAVLVILFFIYIIIRNMIHANQVKKRRRERAAAEARRRQQQTQQMPRIQQGQQTRQIPRTNQQTYGSNSQPTVRRAQRRVTTQNQNDRQQRPPQQ